MSKPTQEKTPHQARLALRDLDQVQFLLGHVSIQTTNGTSAASRNCDAVDHRMGIDSDNSLVSQ